MSRPAVFLDRDGTLIEDRHYLADPAGVRLLPGVREALTRLARAGYVLVVVSNQSGIGRGFFTEETHEAVRAEVERQLTGLVAAWYHCPHSPHEGCECRKPADGLFRRAAADLDLDLSSSIFVGDRPRDVLPGIALGARGILLGEGPTPDGADLASDLSGASDRILGEGER